MSLLPTVGVVLHTLSHAAGGRASRAWRAAAGRERRIRIGVDIRSLYAALTGIGWYTHQLVTEFAKHDDVDLVLMGDARITDVGPFLQAPLPERAELLQFDVRGLPFPRGTRQLTAAAYVALLELAKCDVVFGPNFFLPRLHGAVARRRVLTVHDLTYKRFPELLQQETLDNLNGHLPRELAVAEAIICVSEATRNDVLRYFNVDPARVVTIHSGAGVVAPPEPVAGLPRRYLLFVSTVEPRKDLGTLVSAWERLRADGAYDGDLVVVGRYGWKSEALIERMRQPGIVHLDYLPAAQLSYVYQHAEAFVFPSIYEGFGFPLLEAMTHGVPSIASRSSSLPEIGGDAALYFEVGDSAGLAAQLRRVTSDAQLRERLSTAGRIRAAQFRWDDAAARTLDVLRTVARRT